MTTQQKIRDEISALSRFYGIDPQPFFGLLSPDALEHYVELVLDEQELAVVLGGSVRKTACSKQPINSALPAK